MRKRLLVIVTIVFAIAAAVAAGVAVWYGNGAENRVMAISAYAALVCSAVALFAGICASEAD